MQSFCIPLIYLCSIIIINRLIMAANLYGRYVWLVDTLKQYGKLTYEEINELWSESGLSYGNKDCLPKRTFHKHRDAIRDIFNIDIECENKGQYRYFIDNPEQLENDKLRSWLIDSYATLNQIKADSKLEGRIIYENIPSGNRWITIITKAMRKNKVLTITHHSFFKAGENTFEVEPYCLRVVNKRWYLIAKSPYYFELNRKNGIDNIYESFRTYALDRISEIRETDMTFEPDESFDIKEFFKGCCGIITSKENIEKVVIKAYYNFANYLRTLPLHESQVELESNDEYTLFEYHVKPTFDLYQLLLAQGDQLEVLEPESVRSKMLNFARNLMNYYDK